LLSHRLVDLPGMPGEAQAAKAAIDLIKAQRFTLARPAIPLEGGERIDTHQPYSFFLHFCFFTSFLLQMIVLIPKG
jgi:hypothetical protein